MPTRSSISGRRIPSIHRGAHSAKKIAVSILIGTAINNVTTVKMRVPIKNGKIPYVLVS